MASTRAPILLQVFACLVCVSLLSGASFFKTKTKKGEGGTDVESELVKCAKPIGTAALLEPEYPVYAEYGLSSPVPLVKMMMLRSGCFQVVERGAASSALQRERAMAEGGDLQKSSNMGSGQMVAADYIINPQIVHKDQNAGGSGAGAGGLLPGRIGAVAGLFKRKTLEAQVMLTLTNVRTSVQEAIAEGSASKSDLTVGGLAWVGGAAGIGGSYENTDIGKITAVAFQDAHNNLVGQLGGIQGPANTDNAGWVIAITTDMYGGPSTRAPVLGTLYEETSVIATGVTNGDWWEIEAIGKTGWVHSDFITR